MLRTQFLRSTRLPIRAVMATRGVADNAGIPSTITADEFGRSMTIRHPCFVD